MASSYDYAKKLSQALNNLRKQSQLCDITINISGRSFQAHKNVLAACSSYFMAMFTSGFKESSQSEISIDEDPEVFEVLLEFIYTGEMAITLETAYSILEMACYMQFVDASEEAARFVKRGMESNFKRNNLPITDVYKIYEIARPHDHLRELADVTEKKLCKHFQELKSSEVFLETASAEFLKQFLKCDYLSSEDEEKEVSSGNLMKGVWGWVGAGMYDLGVGVIPIKRSMYQGSKYMKEICHKIW